MADSQPEASLPEYVHRYQRALKLANWSDAVSVMETNLQEFKECQIELLGLDNENTVTKLAYAAIKRNSLTVIEILISHRCDLNHGITYPSRQHGRSPLYNASILGKYDIVKQLLDYGCEKDALNSTGNTALYVSVFEGHTPVVGLLLSYGCDPNIPDVYGNTPLHIVTYSIGVSSNSLKDNLSLLLQGGVDIGAKNNVGQTALDLAVQHRFTLMLTCMMENARAQNYKTLPHSPTILSDHIVPEIIANSCITEGTLYIGEKLLQLHPCHDIEEDILHQLITLSFIEDCPLDLYKRQREFYQLMLLSGISGLPNRSPLTLQQLCRIILRRHFAQECFYQIHSLNIPQIIKGFLLFEDLDEN